MSAMAAMRRLRTAAAAGMALLGTSCGLSLQSLPKLGGVSGPTYSLSATFANVVNLPANAQVRVGAFSVGDVASISVRNFQAVVIMRIKDSVKLPAGTTANVRFDTPLGEDFVLLQPPATTSQPARYLENGDTIAEAQTSTAPSVEDTFAALGALLDGGGINQLPTIISQTDLALNGNQQKIRALIESLNATVTTLARNTPSIDNALSAMAALSRELNAGTPTITAGIAALGPAVNTLAGETSDLQNLFVQLDKLSNTADSIIQASATGTVQTLRALQPLLDQLSSVQQQIGPALNAVTNLEAYTPRAIPGEYLQLSINATIGVPPVPSDAPPLHKITVDPPDPAQSYDRSSDRASIALLLEGALP